LITLTMNTPHFRTLDLNLLKVFVALLEEGNVTRAGARLGLTQSAVSHALSRLRYALGDELFVRGPQGMQPSPRAREIAAEVRQGLAHLQAAFSPPDFVPAEADRRFVLAAGPYTTAVLMPRVAARLRVEAPGVTIRVRNVEASTADALDSGSCDLAVGVFERIPDRFEAEPAYADGLVWVMRRDHPLANQALTLEALAETPHLVVQASDAPDASQTSVVDRTGLERRVVLEDSVDEVLAARGLQRRIALTLSDMHAALAVVARSDMLTLTLRGFFELFGESLGLVGRDPPYPSPPRDVLAVWRRDNDGPALHWFRGLLMEAGELYMRSRAGDAPHGR
jgi:DNA-binding transcriptional LysR family regulator